MGVACAFAIFAQDPTLIIAGAAAAVGLTLLVRLVSPGPDRASLLRLLGLALALRLAVAMALYVGSVAIGHGGFTSGDDGAYFMVSASIAASLHGDANAPYTLADWRTNQLFGTFVYMESALFFVFGPRLLLADAANAFIGALAVLFVWDLTRRVFDRPSAYTAAILVSFAPLLVELSSVNLKDALAILVALLGFWLLVRSQTDVRSWQMSVAAYVPLIPLYSIRRYVAAGLAIVFALGTIVSAGRMRRWHGAALAAGLSTAFLVAVIAVAGPLVRGRVLAELEMVRVEMATGRTAIPGQPTEAVPSPDLVPVGDTFIRVGRPTTDPDAVVLLRTLAYLPRGLTYAIFAPFPWSARTLSDIASVPDVLLWYVVLVALTYTVWTHRAQWRVLGPMALFIGGMVLLFALTEGNVGTLYRHRTAAVFPIGAILASPGLVAFAGRIQRAVR